ncbi:selenocysteine-specific translation elongation factor [Gordonibacter sp. An230]|uniref:selenocysteine-specific translation elongation factor n=1 Tax=Gordonibacter sp. An230 TaxID=1965592 RepID=UPI000B37144F|nr:selenocysteine-specific translation elongation factor [Gordonibacter sp. An230]OUO88901.1 selenocysteine-specific translation elongation factor [Gordonibacter sp. An230]
MSRADGRTREDLVLGTAGHIDHGKSSLVRALTGVDPDRLAEEKSRGITIELGFARLELPDGTSLGIVDVPGHERFVRRMIAGATGIDLALLCVAADDGVMPQTEEHLAVLDLLGVRTGVVALTKSDLVDAEWSAFMAEEVRARLEGTPFADAEIVPVSSRTREGIGELEAALARAAARTTRAKAGRLLRLPVDRAFTVKGAGTVVTGTLWSGTAAAGDEVEVLPSGARTRIRGVQMHGEPVERARAGNRVALNLNALSVDEARPGCFLTAPGALRATDRFDAEVRYLGAPGAARPLESGAHVRVAHGTRETGGRALLMGGRERLAAGERAFAQIRLDEPLPVSWRDRFVLRSASSARVVGGGTVLRARPRRSTALDPTTEELLVALRDGDEAAAARAAFALEALPTTAEELAAAAGIGEEAARRELAALEAEGKAVALPSRDGKARFSAPQKLQRHRAALENALLRFHAEEPAAAGIAKDALRRRCLPNATPECFDALLEDAAARGAAEVDEGRASHPRAGAKARKRDEEAAEKLHADLAAAGAAPPFVAELVAGCGYEPAVARRALGALERQGRIARVGAELCFDAAALEALEAAALERLASGPATAAELKEAMGTSRKYAIPLLEHFDGKGLTRREGDLRVLNAR